jgi:murein DD-endopeptidase MepM/ murein hydrolase activator NlpD
MRMLGFAGPWRAAAVVARWCYCGALLIGATAAAEELCSAAHPCVQAGRSLSPTLPQPPELRGADGGGRAALGSSRAWSGTSSWSAAMSRHDLMLGRIEADHDDAYLYRLPYGDDVSFPVIQAYDARLSHRGAEQYTLDFGMPVGTPVHAARDGVVVLLEDSHDSGCWREECGQLANFVVLLHADGTTGEYFHLQRGSVQVRVGERVRRGELLARSGNTGYSTAPHLHFGVYRTERDGRTQSVAVRFQTRVGALAMPRTGARYLNAGER